MDLDYLIKKSNYLHKKAPGIFLFHGYGSNKEDLFGLADFFPNTHTIISLEAPIKLPFGGYSWFNIDYSDIIENNLDKRYKEINDGVESILSNIDFLSEKFNLDLNDISLLGFSQGGSICWKLGLDHNLKFRRILPISSFIHPTYLNNNLKDYNNLLIYSSHGINDDVIPLNLVEKYILELSKENNLTFEKFESGHTISQENLINIINWINRTNN